MIIHTLPRIDSHKHNTPIIIKHKCFKVPMYTWFKEPHMYIWLKVPHLHNITKNVKPSWSINNVTSKRGDRWSICQGHKAPTQAVKSRSHLRALTEHISNDHREIVYTNEIKHKANQPMRRSHSKIHAKQASDFFKVTHSWRKILHENSIGLLAWPLPSTIFAARSAKYNLSKHTTCSSKSHKVGERCYMKAPLG